MSIQDTLDNDPLICSIGWNCYPGWLIRKIYGQPAFPWDWMQFFSSSSLRLVVNEQGINQLCSDFEIANIVDSQPIDEARPPFFSHKYQVRSPHDHENLPFSSLDDSRLMIRSRMTRRLERLIQMAQGKRLVLVGSFNSGLYGRLGYSDSAFASDIRMLLHAVRSCTSAITISALICGTEHSSALINGEPDKDGLISSTDCEALLFYSCKYAFEDAFYAFSPNHTSTQVAEEYWREEFPRLMSRVARLNINAS